MVQACTGTTHLQSIKAKFTWWFFTWQCVKCKDADSAVCKSLVLLVLVLLQRDSPTLKLTIIGPVFLS